MSTLKNPAVYRDSSTDVNYPSLYICPPVPTATSEYELMTVFSSYSETTVGTGTDVGIYISVQVASYWSLVQCGCVSAFQDTSTVHVVREYIAHAHAVMHLVSKLFRSNTGELVHVTYDLV